MVGHQEHHLPAVLGGLEGRAQRHLGLAVAHVAADQAVHRARLLHVRAHGLDRLELVGRLAVGEAGLELELPLAVGGERVAGAPLALGVEVDQLAGERLGGAARLQLHLLPLLAAELRERRVAGVGAHVAADLVELVARHEDAVAVAVLELEVVARHAADGLGLEAGEERDAVVLVDHRRAGPKVGERGDRPGPARALDPAAPKQPVLGQHRKLELGRDEAVAQAGVGEGERGVLGSRLAVEEGRLHAGHVQLRALGLAAARPGHEGAVAAAHQLLELRLGVLERAGGGVRGLRAELVRLVLRDARQAELGALVESGVERLGLHVELVRVLVVEARRHVLPVVAQRGRQLLLGGDRHQGVVRHEVEQLAEAVHGQDVGHVGAIVLVAGRRDLGQLAVLGRQLGGGRDLHALGLLQRALREGGEPGEPLHLDVEQLAAHRALLGGRVHVEDVAADRELAALLHLLHPLVAACHELVGGLVEVDEAALLDLEPVRAQRRVRHLLGERDRRGHEHRGLVAQQRIERRYPEPDQVRRRRKMRLVAHAARRVEAHLPRGQELPQIRGEVTGRPVVPRHDQRRPLGIRVDQRCEQVRAQARGDEGALRLVAGVRNEFGDGIVVLGVCEE